MELAKKLECKKEPIALQPIIVVDGSDLQHQHMCRYFKWRFHGTNEFCIAVFLIPFGSYDVVLGTQWLRTLGTINWNLNELKIENYLAGKGHVLRGLTGHKVKIIQRQRISKSND